ncbi:iron ABC transporter permease [Oceanobacillus luteolus]|uniref:FecCD family ABC transporter permease n=1 Tax=Oceanobacillus luteolus TaxID=1274358 RepID=A0ABW4HTR4_9BACI|nr:iron ABC transporter permease [Oceanobacillus luteolus]MCM3741551.1 iron ABC transporter permease [Oceanobacillus luteolus]
MVHKQRKWLLILTILFIFTFLLSISLGSSSVSFGRILPTLFGQGSFKEEFILFSVRLPRVIVLSLAGMALAISGALLQSVTRNDLADPGIIGINAGAGVGITCFYLFIKTDIQHYAYVLPAVAFISALLTAALIYFFSYEKGKGIQPTKLVLIGVGFAFTLSGLMMVLVSSAERSEVDFIAQWLAGNIWGADWPFILAILPWLLIGLPIVFYKANTLNILTMSEPTAIGLGIHLTKERLLLIVIAVALAAAAVSITGGIGFIGLMAPHIAKRLVGPRHQLFLPIALFVGSILLMISDTIGRTIIESSAVPAGIIVAFIGAPYFIYLLRRN